MAKHIDKCLNCGKDYENYDASFRYYCSVGCQFGGSSMPYMATDKIKQQGSAMDNLRPDESHMINDIRDSFDPEMSTKANILRLLKWFGKFTYLAVHQQADMALLALINDPDITAAYMRVKREY